MDKYDAREIEFYIRAIHRLVRQDLDLDLDLDVLSEYQGRTHSIYTSFGFAERKWAKEIIDGLRDKNALKIIVKAVELRLSNE